MLDVLSYAEFVGIPNSESPRMVPCDLCGSEELLLLRERVSLDEVTQIKWPVYVCDNCGLILQNPRFSKDFYLEYYSRRYSALLKNRGDSRIKMSTFYEDQVLRGNTFKDALVKIFGSNIPVKERRVLDIGCSSGGMLLPFQEEGWEVHGNDPDSESIEFGRSKGITNLLCENAENMNYPKNFFGIVMAVGTLEHVYSFKSVIEGALEMLCDGGIILLTGRGSPVKHSSIYFNHHHHRYFTPESLSFVSHRYHIETVRHKLDLLGPHRKQSIALLGVYKKKDITLNYSDQLSVNSKKSLAVEIVKRFDLHDSTIATRPSPSEIQT